MLEASIQKVEDGLADALLYGWGPTNRGVQAR
jgi:hypothetical protein